MNKEFGFEPYVVVLSNPVPMTIEPGGTTLDEVDPASLPMTMVFVSAYLPARNPIATDSSF